ncbi:MAG: hypothetical protein R3D25_17610 [Geminicoccaceae bacterium]
MNISSGVLTSFTELASLMLEHVGKRATVTNLSDMPEGNVARGGDTTLQSRLGFAPKIPLAEGVGRVAALAAGRAAAA